MLSNPATISRKALLDAAEMNQTQLVVKLLATGVMDGNESRGDNKMSSLHFAVQNDNTDMIVNLREYAMDESFKGSDHNLTPIVYAAHQKKWQVVLAFTVPVEDKTKQERSDTKITKIADPKTESSYAVTVAARDNQTAVVKVLVASGAAPDVRNKATKETALHYAVRHRNIEMIIDLRRASASETANADSKTPLELASHFAKRYNTPEYWNIVAAFTLSPDDEAGMADLIEDTRKELALAAEKLAQAQQEAREKRALAEQELATKQEQLRQEKAAAEEEASRKQAALLEEERNKQAAVVGATLDKMSEVKTLISSALNGNEAAIAALAFHYRDKEEHERALLFTALHISSPTCLPSNIKNGSNYIKSFDSSFKRLLGRPLSKLSYFLLEILKKDNLNELRKNYDLSTDPIKLLLTAAAFAKSYTQAQLLDVQIQLEEIVITLFQDMDIDSDTAKQVIKGKCTSVNDLLPVQAVQLVEQQPEVSSTKITMQALIINDPKMVNVQATILNMPIVESDAASMELEQNIPHNEESSTNQSELHDDEDNTEESENSFTRNMF